MNIRPLNVRSIGRLFFIVASRSRPNPDFDRIFGPDENLFDYHPTEHVVELEEPGCSCERHTKNTHHYGRICHHLARAVEHVLETQLPHGQGRQDSRQRPDER